MDKEVDKQVIIDAYLLGEMSYRELEKKYGVSRPTINRWVLDYQGIARSRAIYVKGVILQPMKATQSTEKTDDQPATIWALQRELAQEKLRNKLLTAMIDIAEEELKIPIRKKYGTRQSKK